MDILILSASPRASSSGNTKALAEAFATGVSSAGGSAQVILLNTAENREKAVSAYFHAQHVIFVVPVYGEGFPGTSIAFLESLHDRLKEDPLPPGKRKIAFLIHGALPEKSHRSTTAEYAQMLPAHLNAEYTGMINLGDAFHMTFLERNRTELLETITDMGVRYIANDGTLFFPEAEALATGDAMTEAEGLSYCRWVNRFARHISEMQGCTVDLCDKPYAETNE